MKGANAKTRSKDYRLPATQKIIKKIIRLHAYTLTRLHYT